MKPHLFEDMLILTYIETIAAHSPSLWKYERTLAKRPVGSECAGLLFAGVALGTKLESRQE